MEGTGLSDLNKEQLGDQSDCETAKSSKKPDSEKQKGSGDVADEPEGLKSIGGSFGRNSAQDETEIKISEGTVNGASKQEELSSKGNSYTQANKGGFRNKNRQGNFKGSDKEKSEAEKNRIFQNQMRAFKHDSSDKVREYRSRMTFMSQKDRRKMKSEAAMRKKYRYRKGNG